jgi:hypothetical protein
MPIQDITFKNQRKNIMRLLRPVIAAAALLVGVQAQAASYVFYIYSPGIRAVASASPPSPPSTTYATLNPSDMGSSATLSNGNLTDLSSLGTGVRGTIGKSAGKWYFEMTVNSTENGFAPCVGIASQATPLSNGSWASGPGEFTYYGMFTGQLIYGNGFRSSYGGTFTTGDVIGVAVDLDNHQITFYRNGVSLGIAYTSTTLVAGTYFPFISDAGNGNFSSQETLNFGQNRFAFPVPAGFNPGWYQ